MTPSDAARRETEALRERIAAILRINASLDLDTVLIETMDCARRLTDARTAFIVTVDERRVPRDLRTIPARRTVAPERPRLAVPWGVKDVHAG